MFAYAKNNECAGVEEIPVVVTSCASSPRLRSIEQPLCPHSVLSSYSLRRIWNRVKEFCLGRANGNIAC